MEDKLVAAYSGEKARAYDARRAKSSRWQAEIAAMEAVLTATKPACVLDCPFGTGRWIPQYVAAGSQVIGVDLSAGMLAEAEGKVAALSPAESARFALREGSIFDLVPEADGPQPDLIACIRFINWVNFADARRVLATLSRFGATDMIVGASVVPEGAVGLRKAWYRLSLRLINLRRSGEPAQYVHDEAALKAAFRDNGWNVVAQSEIMRRNARVNYFYHLRRV